MNQYFYRIKCKHVKSDVGCSTAIKAPCMESAWQAIQKRHNITILKEYYSQDSLLAGCVSNQHYVIGDVKVNIEIIPMLP